MIRPFVVVGALAIATSSAHAESVIIEKPSVTAKRRTAAVASAVFPGFVLRGSGSWVVGEKRTARRLAILAAIGVGGIAVGGGVVGGTGGYPYTMPLMPVLLGGSGLFFTSWWADIANAAGITRRGTARAAAPWALEIGTVWLHDAYRERGLMRAGARLDRGRVGIGVATLVDAEREMFDGELDLRLRILGAPPTGAPITDGSRLVARTGFRVHDDDDDRVRLKTAEIELIARVDLQRIDALLAGTFMQLSAGVGVERATYPTTHDNNSVLLGTFAWGAYLGDRGELALYYDHRRDSIQGGIAAGRAAGFVGSMGGYVDRYVAQRIAVRGQLDVGSAWVTTFGVRFEGGGR